MKIDLDECTPGQCFKADVCIAGGGIAGLTLATALLNSGMSVALLEGGGLTLEERSQDLYDVQMTDRIHQGATKGRFRTFGGSSTRWGGQLLPYPDDVFHSPVGSGLTGAGSAMETWPVQRRDVEPYYSAVLRLMGVPDGAFLEGSIEEPEHGRPSVGADIRVRYSRWASFRQRNLSTTLGKRCLDSSNIAVYLHANVTRLESNFGSGETLSRARVSNFKGDTFTFEATQFVIGLGVIENARLLLASNVGNEYNQVGRYFHDHLGVHAATLHSTARQAAIRAFAPPLHNNILYTPKLEATAKWRARNNARAVMAHFPIVEPDDSPFATVRLLLQGIQRRKLPAGWLSRSATLPFGSVELLQMAVATKMQSRRAISKKAEFRLNIDVEQLPLADSRISLSESKDRFGTPRAKLHWIISEAEERTVRLFAHTIEAELKAIGIAPIDLNPALLQEDGDWSSLAADTYHMMGGTRMGLCAATSVVDGNLKVHGMRNLYVASCSVFPTGGSSNPTFTMMALTLRLAEAIVHEASRPKFLKVATAV